MTSLPPPPRRAELEDAFPRSIARAGTSLYRVHRVTNDPVYFGNDGGNRFDLVGSDIGTCYLGVRDETAFIEVFARTRPVVREELQKRRIAELTLTSDVRLADMTSNQAIGRFGVTLEMSAGGDYRRPQEWAAALYDAGFGGILYKARHVPGADLDSIALFDKVGATHSLLEVLEERAIGPDILDRMRRNFGFPDPLPSKPL